MSKKFFVSVLGALFVAGLAGAQMQTPQGTSAAAAPSSAAAQAVPEGGMPTYIRPETPEQRAARLGMPEDPGINPDPAKTWWRFGREFTIERYERRWAAYDREPGTVRPMAMVNIAYELYQHNDLWVWVWIPKPRAAEELQKEAGTPRSRYNEETIKFFGRIRTQFTDLTPPEAKTMVKFVESSKGLPTAGSWRNSLTVADMNGDGHLDLVAPPERGGRGTGQPAIFLGDSKGNWRHWAEVTWPRMLDYGSVAAADFNKDGHQDLAFGVHLRGVFVFMGNGKGQFTEVEEGLSREFATRRVVVADVDRDGWMDIVASSEGPTMVGSKANESRVRAWMNRKKGTAWASLDVAAPENKLGGDWLTLANLNGDQYPDFVGSSVFFGSTEIVHVSDGPKKWRKVESDGDLLPSMSYYQASTSGNFSSKKKQDAVISYVRVWPKDLDTRIVPTPPLTVTTNIDHVVWTPEGVKRQPIIRWGGREGVWGIGSGDFDGNGSPDVIYTRHNPREAGLLLGDGKGGFVRGVVEGLDMQANSNYDVVVADVNRDKKPDVILMYESAQTTALGSRDGAIRVFLNAGTATAPAQAAAAE